MKIQQLIIYPDEDLYEYIKNLSKEENRSFSSVVCRLVWEARMARIQYPKAGRFLFKKVGQ